MRREPLGRELPGSIGRGPAQRGAELWVRADDAPSTSPVRRCQRASCVVGEAGIALESGALTLTAPEAATLLADCTKIEQVFVYEEDTVCDGDPTLVPADFVHTDATGTATLEGCPSAARAVCTDDAPAFTAFRALFAADGGS